MLLAEKAAQIEADYGILPDPQERFQYLIEQSADDDVLVDSERIESNRVDGCVSAVWVVAALEEGVVRYRSDGDSPIVKGLAWMLCDFYSGHSPEEIVSTAPAFIERLRLEQALTENRRRGLRFLIDRFQSLASSLLPPS